MKLVILPIFFSLLFSFFSQAQTFSGLDISPMDMAYFPNNFAHDRKEGEKAIIRVTYSRPQRRTEMFLENLFLMAKFGEQEPMKLLKLNSIRMLP
jgi:hypothetical protein